MNQADLLRRVKAKLEAVFQDIRLSESRSMSVLKSHRAAFENAGLSYDRALSVTTNVFERLKEPRSDISMHYEIFAGISQVRDAKRVLEIGTSTGGFTRFLAELFPRAEIETWDLPSESFTNPTTGSYKNIQAGYGDQTEKSRETLEDVLNVVQVRKDSTLLAFESKEFDVIWVDGDHTYPVAAFDIINALRLTVRGGWICVDDIRPRDTGRGFLGSQETYFSVKHLEGAGLVSLHLVMKRLDSASMLLEADSRKYIAVMRRLI